MTGREEELKKDYERWSRLFCQGGQDPFWTDGNNLQIVRNHIIYDKIRLEKEGKSFEELEYLTLGALRKAVMDGDVESGTVMAGQIAGMVKKEQTCKEMIEEMMAQATKLLGRD